MIYVNFRLPVINYVSSVWPPHYRQNIGVVELVQKRFIKQVIGQQNCSYDKKPKFAHSSSLIESFRHRSKSNNRQ